MEGHNKLIVIAGPTACGKTEVCEELARLMNCEIVSADSVQCCKKFDIGSAKPSKEQLNNVKYHMIDEYEPEDRINVYDYSLKAVSYIKEALSEGKNVLLSGGSGLYIDSIVYDSYSYRELSEDIRYRTKLQDEALNYGNEYLFEKLLTVDPEYAEKTHMNNIKRVIRALEYNHVTNKKMSENVKEKHFRFPNTYYFAINVNRQKLYGRINKRVDAMLQEGLEAEARALYETYTPSMCSALNSIGYKEWGEYFNGNIDLNKVTELIKQHTRNFAKRQYTWFRANNDVIWLDKNEKESAKALALKIKEVIN